MLDISKNNKERIFEAAFLLISERGYANVSIRDVANYAKVSLSQVNYHYQSKEGLFKEVLKSVKEEYLTNIEERFQSLDSKKDKLSFFISYLQNLIKTNTKLYQLILDFYSLSLWSEPFRSELKDFLEDISYVIEKYIDGDIIINKKRISSRVLIRTIIGATFGAAMQYILIPDDDSILEGIDVFNVEL